MASIVDSLVKSIFHKSVVSYKKQLSAHVYHIRLQSDELKGYSYTPGEHLRLFVGVDKSVALNEKLRTYSIWEHDAKKGIADLAVCIHSSGVGSQWADQVQVGDIIYYKGPTTKLVVDHSADSYLMIGDDSALSHLYAIRRAIPAHKKVIGLVYASDKQDLFADIDGSLPFELLQLPPNPTSQLTSKIKALEERFSPNTIAYLAGDNRVCKAISRYLKEELKWNSDHIKVRGFWMPGKTGMD